MRAKMIKTLWGCAEAGDPSTWDSLMHKIRRDGFDGVEFALAGIPSEHAKAWQAVLAKHDLVFIAQAHTCTYRPTDIPGRTDAEWAFNMQTFVPSEDVGEHLDSLREQIRKAKALGAVMLNSHSGHDAWTTAQCIEFMTAAVEVEEEEGLPVVHETHRRRVMFTPHQARDVLKAVPGLKVNADLSHWCVVLSRVPTPENEKCWSEVLELLAQRVCLIHARVGYNEGAQVPDPSAPEYAYELAQHERWWAAIWEGQRARGLEVSYIEPEFGPPPYMHTAPHSKARVADLWEINTWMASRLARAFAAKYGGDVRVRKTNDTAPKRGFGDCPASSGGRGRSGNGSDSTSATAVAAPAAPAPGSASAVGRHHAQSWVGVIVAVAVGAFVLGRKTA